MQSVPNASHPYRAAPPAPVAAVERHGFIVLSLAAPWLAYVLGFELIFMSNRGLADLAFLASGVAPVVADVVRFTRKRTLRPSRKGGRIEVTDRGKARLVRDEDVRVVTPYAGVTFLLWCLIAVFVTGLQGSLARSATSLADPEHLVRLTVFPGIIASVAFALHRRARLVRLLLPGDRLGAWFDRDAVAALLPRLATPSEDEARPPS